MHSFIVNMHEMDAMQLCELFKLFLFYMCRRTTIFILVKLYILILTTGFCIFQMVLPRVNIKGFFFPPFSGELPRVNTRVIIIFSAINRQSYSSYSI